MKVSFIFTQFTLIFTIEKVNCYYKLKHEA